MATELTTPSATTVAPRSDIEFRPIDWWVDLEEPTITAESPRRIPPIPAFVRLSRLIDPEKISAARGIESAVKVDPPVATNGPALPETGPDPATTRRWADSAGRPLFRIGLAAIVAAVVVGVSTFGPSSEQVATVESPVAPITLGPGEDGGTEGVGSDEQARQVLEALVRQASGGEADLSIVGTASGTGTDIRWTATIRNEGPETAEGPITVVHTIGSDFELASIAGSGWDCEHLRTAGTITCELDENLGTGQRRRLGLVTSIAGVEPDTKIPSTMSVVAGTTDPDLDDNTINITAVSAPADDAASGARSPSTGAAGQSGSGTDVDTDVGANGGSDTDQNAGAGMEELPRTGSGLVTVLGGAGIGLCLAGRRLMTWSARAQTRTLLVAANID
ncbi:MAG: DUF11 domain-containing protein [Acidimicrobiia bacterium]|nr:DUF11 domain-containing protein [Acidimicrobiia bacterium]